MALYTQTVMDHFMHPRNVGAIENADGVGEVGNAKCGDIMKIYLKIREDRIEDVKFETFGCASAIASSSIATEMLKGKTISDALKLTNKDVVDALGGLPAQKLHCSPTSCTAVCSPRRRSSPPSRIITTKTASRMTRRTSPTARAARPAAWSEKIPLPAGRGISSFSKSSF